MCYSQSRFVISGDSLCIQRWKNVIYVLMVTIRRLKRKSMQEWCSSFQGDEFTFLLLLVRRERGKERKWSWGNWESTLDKCIGCDNDEKDSSHFGNSTGNVVISRRNLDVIWMLSDNRRWKWKEGKSRYRIENGTASLSPWYKLDFNKRSHE